MHIFLPELIYNEIKENDKFKSIYNSLNDFFDTKTKCLIDYNNEINNDDYYKDLNDFLKKNLSEKNNKIWNCFKVCVDFDEKDSNKDWEKIREVIDSCKKDDDLEVKLYAYYMEMANTADHESEKWIENVEESLKLFDQNKDKVFDTRLYTKFYWDVHEKNNFYLKNKKEKDLIDEFKNYQKLDLETKDFIFSKHNDTYTKDIINHKTIYTAIQFWHANLNSAENDQKSAEYVLKKLDDKIANLDFKYNSFNMHLMEWLWLNFKWHLDRDNILAVDVVEIMIQIVEETLKNKNYMIRSLRHHNFNYISNFLILMQNLNEVEKIFEKVLVNYERKLNKLNWTEKEYKVIIDNDLSITNNWWNERSRTLNNYKENMISSIKNKFLG
jgi:hypothetical protein